MDEAEQKALVAKITDVVLDKVGEMLTDNIYDIIPGY
jgi:phenylpyruvate tautomerase PptA (4-oxalocrotonate tautomerase family)